MKSDKDETGSSVEFWRSIEQIEGLSVETGLNRVSGQREDYKTQLELIPKEIEKCSINAKNFLFIKDLHNFRMEIRGIKESLANIGAAQLSDKALELENASVKEDAAFCASNFPPFLEALHSLKSRITEALARETQNRARAEAEPELLSDIDGGSQYFDLITLLSFDDVDIQGVIKNNPSIRVGDYLNVLTKFDNAAAKGTDSLNRIAGHNGDDNDIQILADIMDLLKNMGCTSIFSAIENTVLAGKKGRAAFAASCAKDVMGDFCRLQARMIAAKKEGKPEATNSIMEEDGLTREDYEAQSLKDALIQLEQKEASRKLRILAVDDSPVILSTISSALGGDYKVYGMPKPALVEKFLKQISPDLFLLDYEMPEINGFELIPIIRNFEEHKDTPIVFLTSMGTLEHVSAATALGARDFIVKPFQPDNLREKVARHIARKKLNTGGS